MPGRLMNAVLRGAVDLHRAIVDARQARLDQLPIGHDVVLIVIEPPDVRQRAEGDVELAAGQRARLRSLAKDGDRVLADRDRRDARVLVHADDVAVVFPDAEQRFEAIEFAEDVLERIDCPCLVRRPCRQLQLRAHRNARVFDLFRGRWRFAATCSNDAYEQQRDTYVQSS